MITRVADRISVALWRRRADRVSIEALAEAVADITLEMAGHRERIETLEREAVEDIALLEDACRGRVLRHTQEHHMAPVGLRETT